jgi:hypothetical protein
MDKNTVFDGERSRLPDSLRTKPRYSSNEASLYLLLAHGITTAVRTLDKLRSVGGGPEFEKFNGRALYRRQDLDSWVANRMT